MTTSLSPSHAHVLYRCVYCQRIVGELSKLSAHERQCTDKRPVRRDWARTIKAAKRREASTGHV